MNLGKAKRMRRLFDKDSNRMVLVTMDHGICVNPMKALNDTKGLIEKVAAGGASAVLLTPGMTRLAGDALVDCGIPLMVRIDGTATSIGPDLTDDRLICSVEDALCMGADAVATFGVIGVPREADLSEKIGLAAGDCESLGMPMMTEMIPEEILQHQFESTAKRKWPSDPEVIQYAERVAAELGADIVKGFYTGNPDTFREVTAYCPVPYVVLSGPASGDPEVFLGFVKDAMDAGAAGVSVGRNVWTHKDPTAMTRALCRIVHENASVKQALSELG